MPSIDERVINAHSFTACQRKQTEQERKPKKRNHKRSEHKAQTAKKEFSHRNRAYKKAEETQAEREIIDIKRERVPLVLANRVNQRNIAHKIKNCAERHAENKRNRTPKAKKIKSAQNFFSNAERVFLTSIFISLPYFNIGFRENPEC